MNGICQIPNPFLTPKLWKETRHAQINQKCAPGVSCSDTNMQSKASMSHLDRMKQVLQAALSL